MKAKMFFASLVVLASGCSGITPKNEAQTSYWIYDIKTDKSASDVGTAVIEALQSQMSSVNVSRNIPPSPLPDRPGRFQMNNALGKSNIGLLMATSGISLQMPVCDEAILIASSQNTGMSNWGENTSANSCLWQYKEGYHLDIIVKFTNSSGGYDAKSLAKALVTPITGDSSQFIPTRINTIADKLNSAGFKTSLVEKYP